MKLRPWQGNETRQKPMAIKTFKFKIILKSGSVQEIRVQADNSLKAKELMKLQYNDPKILNGPIEVR